MLGGREGPVQLAWRDRIVMPKQNLSNTIRTLKVVALIPTIVMGRGWARGASGVAVSGERFGNMAKSLMARICAVWVFRPLRRLRPE
jgi:hypothetical protein